MSTNAVVTPIRGEVSQQRLARGAFVKHMMEHDSRSARYMASHIGISNTAFSDRLKGKAPFLADELEQIARVLKLDPIEFYRAYLVAEIDETPHPVNPCEGHSEPPTRLELVTCALQGGTFSPIIDIFTGREAA